MASSPGSPQEQSLSQTVCTVCRQRKIRCDRRRPECGFCSKSGHRCHYQSAQKTPGLRAGYVSRLETRIEVLEREFQDFKSQLFPATFPPVVGNHSSSADGDLIPTAESPKRVEPFSSSPLDLTRQNISAYCSIWFEQYHSWFPILHQPTILESCRQFIDHSNGAVSLVLKSVAAVIIPTQPLPAHVNDNERQKWLLSMEDDITLAAFHNLSLQSLQALLILTIPVFGAGRMAEFYNLMALCKRISTQLGLRDLVNYHCMNFGVASSIPPRMLFIPTTVVEREEKIRAFWAAEALDSISTLGAAWNLSVSRPEPAATIPCDDEVWLYPESVLTTYLFGNMDAPSSFSLFVSLATNELWQVHHFLQESYNQKTALDFHQRQEECNTVYQRLISWEADFERVLAIHSPRYIDLFSTGEGAGQHPNSILIHCTIHSAVISLYQRFIFPVGAEPDGSAPWTCAADRCLASCNSMVVIVRGISDVMLETINPHVIFCVFIAARFYIIFARACGVSISDKLYLLIYALTVAGKRWPLAKQLRAVLDNAATESRSESAGHHPLPREFYDLQYLSWDIHEALRKWCQSRDAGLASVDNNDSG